MAGYTLGPESQNATVITRSDMSKKIAAGLGVPVNDLYGLAAGERDWSFRRLGV